NLVLLTKIVLPQQFARLEIETTQHRSDSKCDHMSIGNHWTAAWTVGIAVAVAIFDGITVTPESFAGFSLKAFDGFLSIPGVKQHQIIPNNGRAGVAISFFHLPD